MNAIIDQCIARSIRQMRDATITDGIGYGLCGYVHATKRMMIEALGQPQNDEDMLDDKVKNVWRRWIGGTYVSVYDYKDHCKGNDKLHAWHIGGSGATAVLMIAHLLPDAKVELT